MAMIMRDDLVEILADPGLRKVFDEAVRAAVRSSHFGAIDGSFNIDGLAVLTGGIESQQYAQLHMAKAARFADRIELLRFAASRIAIPGPVLEFGVFSGETINTLARALPDRKIYGFDSFEGLPEDWGGCAKGHFNTNKRLPPVEANVELFVGWFDQSLPDFLDTHDIGQVALLHVDCDLYSSTKTVFKELGRRIASGTIIVFDEYFNYPGWQQHEYLAFRELVAERGLRYEYIGLAPTYQHVAVRIL